MNENQIREALKDIKCFLLDMDGTFYLGDQILEGSLDFLNALDVCGRRALFVTNNSSRSKDYYVEKLKKMGVNQPFLHVITSAHASAHYVLQNYPGKKGFLLGNDILKSELTEFGLEWDEKSPDYVLIAYDTTLDYAKMTMVCDHVRSGLPYIATHPDFNCPTETGFAPDIGAIIAFIKASTGREPDVISGKPHRGIVDEALLATGLKPQELAMVGDRLYTDIATGVNFGMTSILVLSGEATLDDLKTSDVQPHLIFNRLSDMIEYL